MTFAPVACATGGGNYVGHTYTEAGFTLFTGGVHSPGFATWCADASDYAGPGMFIDFPGETALLTKSGGGTFSIHVIELAHLHSDPYPAQAFTFTGSLATGGTVSQTFTIADQADKTLFQPFVFDASWTNLSSVTFASQDFPYYQFTNVLLDGATTVPEPTSMALLATGLIALMPMVRRRLRK